MANEARRFALLTACLVGVAGGASGSLAQSVPSISGGCVEAGEKSRSPAALPNMARALRERKKLRILAIGATPLQARDRERGHYALVESFLEANYKGLDVEIIDRGVSGEVARDAAGRIKNEVALTRPDVVFWQVGIADAIARTSPRELGETLSDTIGWLKRHQVDPVLIGMRYVRAIAKDRHYQDLRRAIRKVQADQGIMRIGHYEAIEAVDTIRQKTGERPSELDLTEAGAACMADFLSRALAAKLFAKDKVKPSSGK